MRGGFSGCEGIMIYDTNKEALNARYAYYENDDIVVIEGSFEEIKQLKKEREKKYCCEDDKKHRIVIGVFIIMLIVCIFSLICFSFLSFLAIFIFCIGSYFPINVLCIAQINTYNSDEMYHQGKRYHACEHSLLNLMSKKKEINLENLRNSSIYEAECGNVYSGYFVCVFCVLAYLIANIFTIGLLKSVLILFITVIVLFINIFNPYNPFLLLQGPTIEKPTDKEYLLAIELVKNW